MTLISISISFDKILFAVVPVFLLIVFFLHYLKNKKKKTHWEEFEKIHGFSPSEKFILSLREWDGNKIKAKKFGSDTFEEGFILENPIKLSQNFWKVGICFYLPFKVKTLSIDKSIVVIDEMAQCKILKKTDSYIKYCYIGEFNIIKSFQSSNPYFVKDEGIEEIIWLNNNNTYSKFKVGDIFSFYINENNELDIRKS